MARSGHWGGGDVVAWTDHDGAGAPPRGPGRVLPLALASALAAVLAVMLGNDTLCPEHRAWVLALGTAGVVGTVVAIVGLVQSWPLAPVLTMLVALDGVAIGLIDALHDPTRGRLIALGFTMAALLAAILMARTMRLYLWERSVRRQLAPAPGPAAAVQPGAGPAAPTPASEVAEAEPAPISHG